MKEKWIFLPLFLLSWPLILTGIGSGLNLYDEGLSVYGAIRILHGDIPYRDFWTMYAPGQFYASALLFALFGPFLIVERVFTGIVHLSIPVCIYFLSRKIVSWKLALVAWLLSLLWMAGFAFFGYPVTVALLLSLLSALLLARFFSKRKNQDLWLGGVLTGMATLFRHDLGFYSFLSGTVLLIPFIYKERIGFGKDQKAKILKSFWIYTRYPIGVLLVILPVALYYLCHVPLSVIASDLIVFPIKIFPQFRSLPYPWTISNPFSAIRQGQTVLEYGAEVLSGFPFYFPLIVFSVTALILILRLFRKKAWDSKNWSEGLLLLMGITFFSQARVRSDLAHLLPTIILAIPLIPSLLSKDPSGRPWGRYSGIRIMLYVFLFLAFLSFGYLSLNPPSQNLFTCLSSSSPWVRLNLARARAISVEPGVARDLEGAVAFVRKAVSRGEKIFVGSPRHDRIFVNDVLFYFLSERDCATRYHELHPGVATTLPVQREIIGDLLKHRVRCIVLWTDPENISEPNKSSESSGVTDLDDFIKSRYAVVANFGPYSVLKKVDAP